MINIMPDVRDGTVMLHKTLISGIDIHTPNYFRYNDHVPQVYKLVMSHLFHSRYIHIPIEVDYNFLIN